MHSLGSVDPAATATGPQRSVYRRLRPFLRVVQAEALKQHRTLFGSKLAFFSLFVWPALQLATTYYAFKPILEAPGLVARWPLAVDQRGVLLFVTTGALGYTFFWSLVQSAWQFSWERFSGTLELMLLSPANRLVLVLANGAAALIQSTWLFLSFVVALVALVGGLQVAHPLMFVVAFVGLLVPALAWATLLNSVFIFTRDSSFLYTILEEPMSFFAAVRIPPLALPTWVRMVGPLFPLTISLVVLRGALLERASFTKLGLPLLFLAVLSMGMLMAAAWLLRKGEDNARRSGSLTLF